MTKKVPKGVRQIILEYSSDAKAWRAWCSRLDTSGKVSAWGLTPRLATRALVSAAELIGVEIAGGDE